ncbi:hypothetical protein HHK36_025010 [Tetracentron sinense]|uniref:Cyclin-dependent protein kinase inhibitor SMR6 n=1 Tax=Tetracentron sinense TaxID=13715 RepID=A0A835D817_TETSI|nr:hypothetical protein HHK36_025010 [Tetracentron sinense]
MTVHQNLAPKRISIYSAARGLPLKRSVSFKGFVLFLFWSEMGFPEKPQVDGGLESEGKKWVIAGISSRTPLRSISTKPTEKDSDSEEEGRLRTPTAEETRIPERLACPPAPRKRKPSSRCKFNGVREFFTPPDLDSVFIPFK